VVGDKLDSDDGLHDVGRKDTVTPLSDARSRAAAAAAAAENVQRPDTRTVATGVRPYRRLLE